MNKILINDVLLNIKEYQEVKGENEELKEVSFTFSVKGENNYHLMNNLFKGRIKVVIPETSLEFFANSTSSSSQYNGELTEDTFVDIRHTLTVVNDKESELNLEQRLAANTLISEVKITSLIELLIEKEIFTREEIVQKSQLVHERDTEDLVAKILGVK